MTDIFDRALNLINHIKSRGPIAIFRIGKTFRSAKANGELAERAFEKNPNSLVGVYDARCKLEWLEEDLEYSIKNQK